MFSQVSVCPQGGVWQVHPQAGTPWEGTPGADLGFGQGGPQLPRLKVADVAEWSYVSHVSYLQLG